MRVLIASKALVVAAYQRKLVELARQPGIEELTAVVPPSWREPGGRRIALESTAADGFRLCVEPIVFNGSFHLHFWPTLGRVLRRVRPDVVHLDEEPFNLATALGTWQAHRVGARSLFFTWQNLNRRYPPPFSTFERFVYRRSARAIAGNAEAAEVLRAKGYRGPIDVIPQFGVDPDFFAPAPPSAARSAAAPLVVGFAGRLVEEKGVLVLLEALRSLSVRWQLRVAGSGPLLETARARASSAGVGDQVEWVPSIPSTDMPAWLRGLDVLVLPSLTRPNWKEQFGRVLVEAMACAVPVVGSRSGEIPNVVGDAGIIVAEGDPAALRAALEDLAGDAALRAELGRRGRARVLARFTHRHVAQQTAAAYRATVAGG